MHDLSLVSGWTISTSSIWQYCSVWKPQQQPQPVQRLCVSIWNQFHSISCTINYITTPSWLPLLSDPHQWAVFVWPSLLSFPNEGNCFNPLMRHRGKHVHVSLFKIKNTSPLLVFLWEVHICPLTPFLLREGKKCFCTS